MRLRGAPDSGTPEAAHLRVGGRKRQEIGFRQDMGPGHQLMSGTGVVGHWRGVGQGLGMHWDIVVIREVVHNITRSVEERGRRKGSTVVRDGVVR